MFYYTFSNSPPWSGTYTISISNIFSVVAVESLAPANTGTWVEIPSSTQGARTFLVQANPTNGFNTLAVYATPTPAVTSLPPCWSLNGAMTNATVLSISAPAVYEVSCVCGTSALTNFIVVTTNVVTTDPAALNNLVDAPCGTGPSQLGFWNFAVGPILLDHWAGQSNALDSAGPNNGTLYGNVTYTNGVSGYAFDFDGNGSYISFGTNAGNFGTNNFTVDFWMETTESNQQGGILASASNWDFAVELWGGNLLFLVLDSESYTDLYSQGTVNDGLFHHVMLQRMTTNISIYIDGTLDSTASGTGIPDIQNVNNVWAGKDCYWNPFAGALEEIKLWQGNGSVSWTNSRGWPPSGCYNVPDLTKSWTNGLRVDSTNTAKVAYHYLEADGSANVNGAAGTIAFCFSPDWNGGTGPGTNGYLFELGDVTAPGGGWALMTDPAGTGMSFVNGVNGVLAPALMAPIGSWVSNQWHQVVLSYSPAETLLFLDGSLAAGGVGMSSEPDLATRLADGFTVGSDHYGMNQARGVFNVLTTYNCPLDASGTNGNWVSLLGTNAGFLNTAMTNWMTNTPAPYTITSTNGLQVFTPLK
jgi:hypothetical protein